MRRLLDGLGLNLGLYFYRVRQWMFLAILPAILAAAGGYLYTKHQHQSYQATATLYVQQAPSVASSTSTGVDAITGSELAATYGQMASSQTLDYAVNRVMAAKYPGFRLGLDPVHSSQETSVPNSQLVDVSVTDPFPQRAIDATNALSRVFIRRIAQLERSRFAADNRSIQHQINGIQADIVALTKQIGLYHGDPAGLRGLQASLAADQNYLKTLTQSQASFRAARDAVISNVSIYALATGAVPTGPHPISNAIIWGLLALVLCGGLIYAHDYLNDLPRSPEEVEAVAKAPILGTVQSFRGGKSREGLIVRDRPRSPVAEAYRHIRANLQFVAVDHRPRTILISSALPSEGKSTTASNLAQVFAEAGRTVRLVDSDLRRPSLHRTFNTPAGRRVGLTTLLSQDDLNGNGLQSTEHANLTLIASGPIPPNPADLLESARMRAILAHLTSGADLVILDSPPVLAVADAAILAAVVDGVVLVVDPTRTKRREIQQAREAIETVGGKLLGIVLNRLRPGGALYYQYYSYYGNKHGYTSVPSDAGELLEEDEREMVPGATSE